MFGHAFVTVHSWMCSRCQSTAFKYLSSCAFQGLNLEFQGWWQIPAGIIPIFDEFLKRNKSLPLVVVVDVVFVFCFIEDKVLFSSGCFRIPCLCFLNDEITSLQGNPFIRH